MNSPKGIIFFALILFTINALGQGNLVKVQGKVLDQETRLPVTIKTRIVYEKLPYGDDMGLYSTSNDNSDYAFWLLANNKYLLRVSAEGYFPYSQEIMVDELSEDGQIQKDIMLISQNTNKVIRMENLVFEQGKAEILPSSFEELNTLVTMMKTNESMKVQLEGHTDFRGRPSLNMELSQNRVEAVQKYLVDRGIKKKRISVKAFGGTQPLTRENTEEARRKNRRVEVRILEN